MVRNKLPETRPGLTHKFMISNKVFYLRTGNFEDGCLGEIFIDVDKEGEELRVYDCFAISVSMGLQYGIPLDHFVEKFKHQKFRPAGPTSNEEIPMASSAIDYIFRWLEMRYLSDSSSTPQQSS